MWSSFQVPLPKILKIASVQLPHNSETKNEQLKKLKSLFTSTIGGKPYFLIYDTSFYDLEINIFPR